MVANVSAAERQNRLHDDLNRYVNGRGSRTTVALSVVVPSLSYTLGARSLSREHQLLQRSLPAAVVQAASVSMADYSGSNAIVHRMAEHLAPLQWALRGAYIHGSLATGEETAYSDFDALVILRDLVLQSPRRLASVARALGALQRIMIEFDPLQHHGWFVLTETDLRWYCDAYFPVALFPHARSLLPGTDSRLQVAIRDSTQEHQQSFHSLAEATLRWLESGRRPANVYALKSLLSQIMLLPALYVQARDGKGVFKKFSFDLARDDFETELWAPMDEVSTLRQRWHYELPSFRRAMLIHVVAGRRLVTRWLSPAIPGDLQKCLTPALWAALVRLIRAMKASLEHRQATVSAQMSHSR